MPKKTRKHYKIEVHSGGSKTSSTMSTLEYKSSHASHLDRSLNKKYDEFHITGVIGCEPFYVVINTFMNSDPKKVKYSFSCVLSDETISSQKLPKRDLHPDDFVVNASEKKHAHLDIIDAIFADVVNKFINK